MTETNQIDGGKITFTTEATEIESLQAQLLGEHEMYLRSLADFDNYRRRTERDAASLLERGKRDLLYAFLEIVDSFERALQHVGHASASMVEGLEATHRKTIALLQAQGVTPYKSAGERFDPALHEAVATVGSDQHAPGIVIDELQRGYKSGEVVLRPAMVRVSKQI
jgi:molecular chaperone GrpE